MSSFRPIDRKTPYLLPPSLEDWLPEDHLARFIVEVVDGLDLSCLEKAYAGRGSAAYHPALLLSLLVYGYSTGVFSSRKIERASYDSVAFRYIAAGSHPDHDTLSSFRRRFLDELSGIFVQVLELAREMKLLKLGTLSLDGTKIHANASRHSAHSYGHIEKIETQLKAEVEELLVLAEQADRKEVPDGVILPEEIKRREDRLSALAAAKAKIEARARERFEREQAAHEAQVATREAKAKAQGKKPGGVLPKAPTPGARERDQINLTDEESRIMPVAGGGFEQAYNAQAVVDTESLLVVATEADPGAQRQRTSRPAPGPTCPPVRAPGQDGPVTGRHRLLQRKERRGVRRCEDRATDRHRPGPTSPRLARALHGTRSPAGGRRSRGAHGASAQDEGGAGGLCAQETDGGAGVRHHQIRSRIPPISHARTPSGHGRMAPGLPGMEFEAHGRIASAVGK
jgi:transposase